MDEKQTSEQRIRGLLFHFLLLKENHPRFAAVFSFAKPCRNPRKTDWKDIKK
ncbi:hypothetical protein [Parabacteroides distasonis]|uniref:hypothetical protein n=1 Tax=Parabacteroides distasonis TaxID=823 RepID=UPI001C033EF7|nr:hypothetical protein [Parabacteroides distasonis]